MIVLVSGEDVVAAEAAEVLTVAAEGVDEVGSVGEIEVVVVVLGSEVVVGEEHLPSRANELHSKPVALHLNFLAPFVRPRIEG